MVSIRTWVATTAACALLLSGCGSSSNGSSGASGSSDGLLKAGQLKVCSDVEFPPLEFFANGTSGQPTGFDIDLATAIAKELRLKPFFVNIAFDGLIPSLQSKRCDAIFSGLTQDAQRDKILDGFGYLKSGYGLLVPAGNPLGLTSKDDLAGKRVAVASGTNTLTYLQGLNKTFAKAQRPQMKLSQYSRFTEEVAAVQSGKADAMVELDVSVGYIAQQQKDKLESVNGAFPTPNALGAYANKGAPVRDLLKKGYAKVYASGEAKTLAQKYGLNADLLVAP